MDEIELFLRKWEISLCAKTIKSDKYYYKMCTLTQKERQIILINIEQPIAHGTGKTMRNSIKLFLTK
jgi:hypothetical protein